MNLDGAWYERGASLGPVDLDLDTRSSRVTFVCHAGPCIQILSNKTVAVPVRSTCLLFSTTKSTMTADAKGVLLRATDPISARERGRGNAKSTASERVHNAQLQR